MDYNRAINLAEVGRGLSKIKNEYFKGIGFARLEHDFATLHDCFVEIKEVLSDNGGVWYAHPVQVVYSHGASPKKSGIAFQDYIIDATSGEVVALQVLYEEAARDNIKVDDCVVEYDWKNIDLHLLE